MQSHPLATHAPCYLLNLGRHLPALSMRYGKGRRIRRLDNIHEALAGCGAQCGAHCLQLWRVNLRRNRANLRDDAAMHLSFAREKIRCERDVEFAVQGASIQRQPLI